MIYFFRVNNENDLILINRLSKLLIDLFINVVDYWVLVI